MHRPPPVEAPAFRHRLALVLGSGGVRSVAAVGIVEALAREGIRPDLVVGCSSGAIFGATIAHVMTPRDALAAATSLWSQELTQQKRWWAFAQLAAPRLTGFGADFALRDSRLIARRLEQAFGGVWLEELATPLRVAATDALRGEPVVLTRGRLVDALLASIAVPFIFESVLVGGRRLVDGVISDPLPIAAAADAQVVLTLGFEGAMPRRVDRPSRMVAQVSTALINNLQRARVAAASAAGQRVLALELELERRVGLWETAALPRAYEAGTRAAIARLPEIARLLAAPPRARAA